MPYFIGVDVGTGSVRAAVADSTGKVISLSVKPIKTWQPCHKVFQQSSTDIWNQVCCAVRDVIEKERIPPSEIKGIGFDGTCSLVVLRKDCKPLSVDAQSSFKDDEQNIILWADHRAEEQAAQINSTHHDLLKYVGGQVSPEMEIPKILWLKQNLPATIWNEAAHFFDLPDFLTFKATGSLARSTCSLCCKCSYVSPDADNGDGWKKDYFEQIGLPEFVEEDFVRLGGLPGKNGIILSAGDRVGNGLTVEAAELMGLLPGTPVGSAVIDAYAGAIATLGGSTRNVQLASTQILKRLAIICGTSSCHVTLTDRQIFVPGVWGPYTSVIIPKMSCAEGGQSSTGQLLDHIITTHPYSKEAAELAQREDVNIYALLNKKLREMQNAANLSHVAYLIKDLHLYPDYNGNRSPVADVSLTGMMCGLTLDVGINDLAKKYLSALVAIACQTRHIKETMNDCGYAIDTLALSGGLCNNPLFVSLHADVTRCEVILPLELEGAVVLGAAILGARASGLYGENTLWDIMVRMSEAGATIQPCSNKDLIAFFDKKYAVFLEFLADQRKYQEMMK